ncbi:MAG: hypothetical protein U9O94_06590 [Nanoarchaeota archaeon]|nr:hypothetical protein [Nanoarchaeota archaeon]
MNDLAEKIVEVKEEIKYYEALNRMEPSRTLGILINKLKVRKNTLEEFI